MNYPLFKVGLKGSWKLWLIFLAVIAMYTSVVISMFDPDIGSVMADLTAAMPEMMALFGMQDMGSNLVEFMASYLYGMIFVIFPMVYTIMTANRLVAKHVDRGSMAYLLAAPVSRRKVAFTQLCVLLTGVFLLIAVSAGIGAIAAQLFFPSALDYAGYFRLNGGVLLLHFFIAGICYFASCLFNDTKWSIAFGAGIPVLFYVVQMIANLGGDYENVKYVTFFTLFSPTAILQMESWVGFAMAGLFIGSIALYTLAIVIFNHKDVPV